MKVLYVGDPHVTVAELDDGWALIELVSATASQHNVDAIVFLGDQYHHHGIVHLEVMHFWMRAIDYLWGNHSGSNLAQLCLMVGNHDKSGNGDPKVHALLAHKGRDEKTIIVDAPKALCPGVTMVPHMDHQADFLGICSLLEVMEKKAGKPLATTLVCHQTWNGGVYDNGFRVMDGWDSDKVPQAKILSGHIHAPQEFGKVWYVGAPRWRTASDANVERHIWVVDHDADGNIIHKTAIPTGGVCRRIWDLTMEESDTQRGFPFFRDQYDTKKDDVRITLKGGEEYLKTYGPQLEHAGFRVRTVKTGGQSSPRVRESEGIGPAFQKFLGGYQPKHSTPKDVLAKLAQERLSNA